MAEVCEGQYRYEDYKQTIKSFTANSLMGGVRAHTTYIANGYADFNPTSAKAATRRWGSYLRREARRRGLL